MKRDVIERILQCPSCYSASVWTFLENKLTCNKCKREFKIDNNCLNMLSRDFVEAIERDPLDNIKYFFKRFDKLYNFLIWLISPIYADGSLKRFVRANCENKQGVVAINLGSGSSCLSDKIINIDMFNFKNVDLVCDIKKLPFKDNSVDVAINVAVLEHVPAPEAIIDEIYRVLKPGGLVYSVYPFIVGFHASPNDYTRVTHEGIRLLHNKFKLIRVDNAGGPTSGMLWVLQEWLSIILSFGIKKIHPYVYLFVMVCTFPIKFLDIILNKFEISRNISSCFAFLGKKE